VAQLGDTGHVVRGWLGVAIQPVTAELAKSLKLPEAKGALVASVVENSPAAKAGLRSGDVIVEFDGRSVARSDELPRVVAETPVGRQVPIKVVRDGKPVTVNAQIAKLNDKDEEEVASAPGEGQPSLGLSVQTLTPNVAESLGLKEQHGVLVRGVEDGSAAASAGVSSGDVILEVDRQPVKTVEDMRRVVQQHPKGTPTLLLLSRKGDRRFVAVAS
jgi:serine protease Do